MSALEWRASISLASIFALRMLGLFLILPVFAVHASSLPGGQDAALVGLAIGIYGLTQCFLQIPFGMASDRYGRKPVIIVGLVIFALGSLLAAYAHDVHTIVIGRAIQGAGAISAAVSALIADATREQHRTKAMALVGASIGLTFAGSLVVAPVLYHWIGLSGLFILTGVLAIAAIGVVIWVVPVVPAVVAEPVPFSRVLTDPELMRLNFGIFALHVMQTALFVVVPSMLVNLGHLAVSAHWQIYLPVVLLSFALMLPPLLIAEKRGQLKYLFLAAIAGLCISELLFWQFAHSLLSIGVCLLAFFVVFNILEATLPSLVSRIAPPGVKGSALGVYNTLQALGVSVGGLAGGTLVKHWSTSAVFVFGAVLVAIWFVVALPMRHLPVRNTQTI